MRRVVMYLPAFIPAAFTLLLIVVWLRGNLYNYLPTNSGVYNDGIFYYRQMNTFKWADMNGGYFTLNEKPAAAPYTHFYAHGPAFAVVYGTFAKLVSPTYPQTIIVFHLIGVTIGGLIYLHFAKLRGSDVFWFVAYIATSWSVLFYLPSAMQEGMQISIAFMLGGLAIPIVKQGHGAPRWTKIAFAFLAGAAALSRPSWSFLLLPYALLIQPSRSWRHMLLAVASSGLSIAALTGLYFYQAAPWPLQYLQSSLEPNPILRFIMSRIEMTIRNLAVIFEGDGITLLTRWETIILLMLALLVLLREGQIRRRLRGLAPRLVKSSILTVREALFHALNLGMIFVVVMSFYVLGGYGHDLRLFAPHRLITVLLLIAYQRWKLMMIIIVLNIIVMPLFLQSYYDTWHIQFVLDRPQVRAFLEEMRTVIPYDSAASSGWCNTVLIGMDDINTNRFVPEMLAFPMGLGVSFFINPDEVEEPLKSRYVLLKESQIDYFTNTRLIPIHDSRIGTFYRNEDATCEKR